MKQRSVSFFVGLLMFVGVVSMACNAVTGAPAEPTTLPVSSPTQAPVKPTQEIFKPTQEISKPTLAPTAIASVPPSNGGLVTFVDQNNHYQMQVPSDWKHEQFSGENYYIDQFESPDEQALIENIAYDDGTPFTGSQNGQFALQLLNRFYSNTGQTGDIRVSDDTIMNDGSERLTWTSRSGGYSGISFFEIRNRTTFLMITIEWMNSSKDQYFDLLSEVIESYVVP